MIRSVIQKANKTYFLTAMLVLSLLHFSFKAEMTEQEVRTMHGVVKELNIEQPGAFEVSSAEHMLGQL